jgi:hypothetical protein
MSTPIRIGGFVAVLALLFGAAFGVGRLFDDEQHSYALRLSTVHADAATPSEIRFRILDGDGKAVTRYAVRHEKRLHLILVRKDFAEFRHLHPTMGSDGEWNIDTSRPGGRWRLFADFQPVGGSNQVVHRDFVVAGKTAAPEVRQPYQVALTGKLTAGGSGSMLSFRVTKGGKPVTLQPYLGAFGHLVVLREKDLRYLHVHPAASSSKAPIPFHVEVPTAGRYHLYLDYQVAGAVHTASFVLDNRMGGMGGMEGMDHGDH